MQPDFFQFNLLIERLHYLRQKSNKKYKVQVTDWNNTKLNNHSIEIHVSQNL